MRKHKNFREYHIEKLKDPNEAAEFLKLAIEEFGEDKDQKHFLTVLRDITEAQGSVTQLAKATGLNRQNLYKIFNEHCNPRLETFIAIINELGIELNLTFKEIT